jgi:hypothetical protein
MAEQQGGNRKRMKKLIMFLGLVLWVCGLTGDANASSIHNIIVGQIVSSRQVMVDQEPSLLPELYEDTINRSWATKFTLYKWARKKGAFSLASSILSGDEDTNKGSWATKFTLYKWARKKGAFPLALSILSEDYDLAPAKIIGVDAVANPIPSSMLLLGTGLAGLVWVRKKFKKG